MLSDSDLLKKFGNYLFLFNTHCKNHKCYIQALTRKEDAQRIHRMCFNAKGILRLQMQAASLPSSVPCNPGKDFLNFTNLSINTEKPQEWRTSPFRRHLMQNEHFPPGILSPQKFCHTHKRTTEHYELNWSIFLPTSGFLKFWIKE